MLGTVVHTCNPSWEAEAEGLKIQGGPGLHSPFKAILGNIARSYLKKCGKKIGLWKTVLV